MRWADVNLLKDPRRLISVDSIKQVAAACVWAIAGLAVSCGPSAEDENRAREAARLKAVAESEQALAAFAKGHGATPISLIDSDESTLTADLQRRLEGSTVAFRSPLLDVVRSSSSGTYVAIFGDRFLGGTVVALRIDEQLASNLLTKPVERDSDFLVAATIDSVAPMVVTLEPCRDQDCAEVEIEVRQDERAYRIEGTAIAIQAER
jgi:hypothetical protein